MLTILASRERERLKVQVREFSEMVGASGKGRGADLDKLWD